MNDNFYTQTFADFAAKVGPMDLALYAGAGIIIWVLFQDKLVGLKSTVLNLVKNFVPKNISNATVQNNDDKFFALVSSWKKTRDLAQQVGCSEAVKVADQMFPYLSPQSCVEKKV